ncbi:MAG: hypothetical protein ACPG31_05050 [Planctomycetota bacterium]
MINWIPKQHLPVIADLPAQERRRIWWGLYRATFQSPRAIGSLLVLAVATFGGIWTTSPITGLLFFVSFWLHWAVCGRIAYPKVEEALRADGLLTDLSAAED